MGMTPDLMSRRSSLGVLTRAGSRGGGEDVDSSEASAGLERVVVKLRPLHNCVQLDLLLLVCRRHCMAGRPK